MNNAGLYATANLMQRRDSESILREIAAQMTWSQDDSELVLDIGCGSGDVTNDILVPVIDSVINGEDVAEVKNSSNSNSSGGGSGSRKNSGSSNSGQRTRRKSQVVAVDVSSEMVQHAKQRYTTEYVHFSHLDIGHDIDPTRCIRPFNKVFSFYCLHWVKDQSAALRNIHRLLKPGGEALLVFLAKNPIFDAYRRMADRPQWEKLMEDVEEFVPQQQDETDPASTFRALLLKSGLESLRCETRESTYDFESTSEAVAAVRAVNPFIARLDPEDTVEGKQMQAAYLKDLMMELTPSEEERATFKPGVIARAKYTLMVVHARRPSQQQQQQLHQELEKCDIQDSKTVATS